MKNIDKYGDFVCSMWMTPVKPKDITALSVMALGLAGETGEALEHIKKEIRDGHLDKAALAKELGDVAYYWARICRYYGLELSDVLELNIEKLQSRKARGKMRGDGDNR